MTEQNHLKDFYTSHTAGNKSYNMHIVAAALKEAMKTNSQLKEHARVRLQELRELDASCNGQLARRCSISHDQRNHLEEAFK